MKSFIDYLVESVEEKKYVFKIKVAGDLSEEFNTKLKGALEKFVQDKIKVLVREPFDVFCISSVKGFKACSFNKTQAQSNFKFTIRT
jgi:hypothetical protein